MATRDLHNNTLQTKGMNFTAISTNTTTQGVIIDTLGYESIEFIAVASAYTDGTYTFTMTTGDQPDLADGGTSSQDSVLGSLTGTSITAANTPIRLGNRSGSRYMRLNVVSTGVTSGATIGVIALLGHPRSAPTAAA